MDKLGQLIKCINDFKAQQNKRCVHQIKIEMHQRLETKCFLRPERISREVMNQTQYASEQGQRPAKASPAKETEGFRRRGSVGFVANLFLAGGFVFDYSYLPVYAP